MPWTAADITAVEAVIRAIITGGAVKAYSITGRPIRHMTLAELQALRDEMRAEGEGEATGGLPWLCMGLPTQWGQKGGNS